MTSLFRDIATTPTESLTLLDLQRMVRATLEMRFDTPVWISAEVSELKLNRSGHCYLNLVEKGANDGAPRAEARAVIWRSAYTAIAAKFAAATGATLTAGITILVRVVVTYHEVYGFSLQIVDIDPSFTLGEVERRRRQTIAQLQADGVWDMNREMDMSRPTLRIAIVSSSTAAGYQDFMNELRRAPYRFSVTLFESLMQGDAAEASVVAALDHIAEREDSFDVVTIIRGGGSTSDLALFDSYRIASHVAQFPLPVITGIGHDKDVSVADMVAHTSCKTPTAVATLLVELADAEYNTIESLAQQLRDSVVARIANERLRLERSTSELARTTAVMLNGCRLRLDNAELRLRDEARNMICREKQRTAAAESVIDGASPAKILRFGFAIVRGEDGRAVNIDRVASGDNLSIEVHGGTIDSVVTKKRTNKI
ncbi:MAG: exodeoxyribonuclease VII large subunit [Alistipes sp.]|nr:exodeoxyribonuclease VII large subunit [Alistipes sp.]